MYTGDFSTGETSFSTRIVKCVFRKGHLYSTIFEIVFLTLFLKCTDTQSSWPGFEIHSGKDIQFPIQKWHFYREFLRYKDSADLGQLDNIINQCNDTDLTRYSTQILDDEIWRWGDTQFMRKSDNGKVFFFLFDVLCKYLSENELRSIIHRITTRKNLWEVMKRFDPTVDILQKGVT